MMNILKLTKWEFFKIMKTSMAMVILALLVAIMGGITYSEFQGKKEYDAFMADENDPRREFELSFSNNWRDKEEQLIINATSALEDPFYDTIQRETIRRRIEIAEYKLETNTERSFLKNMWYFFGDDSFKWVTMLLVIAVAIVGTFNLAGEYSEKTISPLLLMPYKRYKILTAKYLATLLYGFIALGIVIILGILSGIIIFGFDAGKGVIPLYGTNGPYFMSSLNYSILVVLFKTVDIIFITILSFFIAVLLKSTTVASITTIITVTLLSPFIIFASKYYNILNYTPFTNLDFRKFLEFGSVMPSIENGFENVVVSGISPLIAALIVLAYSFIFLYATYFVFCKKDVK